MRRNLNDNFDNLYNGLDLLTGKTKLHLPKIKVPEFKAPKIDLPTVKVEPTEETIKQVKAIVYTLAGAISFLGLCMLLKKK